MIKITRPAHQRVRLKLEQLLTNFKFPLVLHPDHSSRGCDGWKLHALV